mmetsp:Transcript_25984/g.57246  ORF Transcript_25984/g.57246 Transcript_25984/m.57246 type:complete len:232 (-) Transcript_25984:121-816(-)
MDEQPQHRDVAVVTVRNHIQSCSTDIETLYVEQPARVFQCHLGQRIGNGNIQPVLFAAVVLRVVCRQRFVNGFFDASLASFRTTDRIKEQSLSQKSFRVFADDFQIIVPALGKVGLQACFVKRSLAWIQVGVFQQVLSVSHFTRELKNLVAIGLRWHRCSFWSWFGFSHYEHVQRKRFIGGTEDVQPRQRRGITIVAFWQFFDHPQQRSRLGRRPDEGIDGPPVARLALEV